MKYNLYLYPNEVGQQEFGLKEGYFSGRWLMRKIGNIPIIYDEANRFDSPKKYSTAILAAKGGMACLEKGYFSDYEIHDENGNFVCGKADFIKCSHCKNIKVLEGLFSYNGKRYCKNCLYQLLIDMEKDGIVKLDYTNVKKNGIKISVLRSEK